MSTFSPTPSDIGRRRRSQAGSPGVGGVLQAVGLAAEPVSTRAADRAAQVVQALGLGADVVQSATGLRIAQEVGDRQAEADRLTELERRAKAMEDNAAAVSEIDRGLAARHARELFPTIRERIARGEIAVPEGADVAQFVADLVAQETDGQSWSYAQEFSDQITPSLISELENQRTTTIAEAKADTARALANAASTGQRVGSVRASAARLGLSDAEYFDGVVRSAANLAGADVAAVEKIAASAPEQFQAEAAGLVNEAKAKKIRLDSLAKNGVRQQAFKYLNQGNYGIAEQYLRSQTADGKFDEDEANVIYRLIGNERDAATKQSQANLEAQQHQQSVDALLSGLSMAAKDPLSGGLGAITSTAQFKSAWSDLGMSEADLRLYEQQTAAAEFAAVDAMPVSETEKNARKVAYASANMIYPDQWRGESTAAMASIGSGDTEMSPLFAAGYNRWRMVSAENRPYALSLVGKDAARIYEMVDIAKRYVFPDDPAAGIDNTGQAYNLAMRAMQRVSSSGLPDVSLDLVKKHDGWIKKSAYNAPTVRDEIRRLASLYVASGADPRDAVIDASKTVEASFQRIGAAYAYARDSRLPDHAAGVANIIIDKFAEKYGTMMGVDAGQLAMIPDASGNGLWQIMDVSGSVPKPLPTDLGGGKLRTTAFSFTAGELAAIASKVSPAPDYAREAVDNYTAGFAYNPDHRMYGFGELVVPVSTGRTAR